MKFDIILADPPWSYASRSPWNKTRFGGGVHGQYPVMTNDDIIAMGDQIKQISSDTCALFLWATCPNLPIAIEVMAAWGFRYCTVAFVWVKSNPKARNFMEVLTERFKNCFSPSLNGIIDDINDNLFFSGPGHYSHSNIELCLLGAKGSLDVNCLSVHQVVLSPINKAKHSRKPTEVRKRIEKLCNSQSRIELFCTEPEIRDQGWLPVGNEIDGKDIRDALKEIMEV